MIEGSFVKFDILRAVYQVYDDCLNKYQLACRPGCSSCCTQSVFVTTLEAAFIIEGLKAKGKEDILKRINGINRQTLPSPRLTTNDLADYCLKRQEPPTEDLPLALRPCPFLEKGLCLIYEYRPFACRSLVSEQPCAITGEALMPEELITINIFINQLLEHIDVPGYYGNLILVLDYLKESLGRYLFQNPVPSSYLAANKPIPGFLYPPKHDQVIKTLLNKLALLRIGKIDMRLVLNEIFREIGHV